MTLSVNDFYSNYGSFLGLEPLSKQEEANKMIKISAVQRPVKPVRDMVLLVETTIFNHRLKRMGNRSATHFNRKLLEAITRKKRT